MMTRETLGRVVRQTWVAWASEQPDPKPSWLTPWETLDAGQREVDMRIADAVVSFACSVSREELEAREAELPALRAALAERDGEIARWKGALTVEVGRLQTALDCQTRQRADERATHLEQLAEAAAEQERLRERGEALERGVARQKELQLETNGVALEYLLRATRAEEEVARLRAEVAQLRAPACHMCGTPTALRQDLDRLRVYGCDACDTEYCRRKEGPADAIR